MQAYKEAFADADVYAVLGVDRAATPAQIKKAYFKKALQWVSAARHSATGRGEGARAVHERSRRRPVPVRVEARTPCRR